MKRIFFRDQRGQAMVELALVLPILLVLFMVVVEFGRVFHAYLIITNASREGARIAVVGKSDVDITARVGETASELDSTKLQAIVTPIPSDRKTGELCTVEVKYQVLLAFPLFEKFLPNPLPIASSTTMRVE